MPSVVMSSILMRSTVVIAFMCMKERKINYVQGLGKETNLFSTKHNNFLLKMLQL